MATVKREVLIDAPPDEVFDLICRVEDFSKYSTLIKEVRALGDERFLWRVTVLGIKLEWEAEVTESIRPASFAWRSTSGLYNTGRYELTPEEPNSTKVAFEMEYRLSGAGTELIIAPLTKPVMAALSRELIEKIKEKLER